MEHPPPIPEVSPREPPLAPGLRCPHCAASYALTWKRYLRAPTGRHRCSMCGAKSRLSHSLACLAAIVALAASLGMATVALVTLLARAHLLALAPLAVVADVILLLVVDRYMDERVRRLIPLRKPK